MAPPNDEHEQMTHKPSGERFDDDRLLAYALDLAPDAELERALVTDAALRERLESVRADLNAVEDQVRAAVPAPEESWADLSAARWDGLRPYVAPRAAPAHRRRRFSLRVLAPAVGVAAAAALAVGIALSQSGGTGGTRSESAHVASGALPQPTLGAGKSTAGPPPQRRAADYRTVVVARAAAVTDGVQDFSVLRTLKGSAGQSVRLQVEAGGGLKEGTLALLLLTPIDTLGGSQAPVPSPAPAPSPSGTATAGSPASSAPGASPAPPPPSSGPSAAATAGAQVASPLYLYNGTPAAVRILPAGTDPASVTLP